MVVDGNRGRVGSGKNNLWWNKSGEKKNIKFSVALHGTELVDRP